MQIITNDRVRETTSTVGIGSILLLGAVNPPSHQPFSTIGNGNATYYCISMQGGDGSWEVGQGTYNAETNTLSRDFIFSSSNGGEKVNFQDGIKDIFSTLPASKAVLNNTNPSFTYEAGVLSRVDYLSGHYKTFSYTDGKLTQSDFHDGIMIVRKTFNYVNGVLSSVNQSII